MDNPIYTVMLTYVFYFSRPFLLEGAVLIPKIGGGGIERTLQFHGWHTACSLLFLQILNENVSSPSTSWDPLGNRSAQTDLQPFYVRRRGPRFWYIYVLSLPKPILSAVDPSPHPAAVHGDSVQTTAHTRAGTAVHRQDTPRGGSRTVRQSHLGIQNRSSDCWAECLDRNCFTCSSRIPKDHLPRLHSIYCLFGPGLFLICLLVRSPTQMEKWFSKTWNEYIFPRGASQSFGKRQWARNSQILYEDLSNSRADKRSCSSCT